MAIVTLSDGEERWIEDSLVTSLAFEPLSKKRIREQLANLRDQLANFPVMTNAEKIAYAEAYSPQYLARMQIKAQIDRLQKELEQWPSP